MAKKVAIIGAGNGGFATAADLGLRGFTVSLFELPAFEDNIKPFYNNPELTVTGVYTGEVILAKATTDIADALADVKMVIVATNALAHKTLVEIMLPHLREDHIVFIMPGNAGSLLFANSARKKGIALKATFVETITLPYGCRKTGDTCVNISRLLGRQGLAALPSDKNQIVLDIFNEIYPESFLLDNVLEIAISNSNLILHPTPTLLSASRIEYSKGEFYLYKEAFTPAVLEVTDEMDREVVRVKKALGMKPISHSELFAKRYDVTDFRAFIKEVIGPKGNKGPSEVSSRYITEDTPVGLSLLSSLGKYVSVPTPTFDASIQFAGLMNKTDYQKTGMTMETLGLAELTLPELREYLATGKRP